MRAALSGRGVVGFVPTMGYLHEGHATLIRQARRACDVVVLSIFVNPLQFGPKEDLAKYPRDLERDLHVAAEAGVDAVFYPEVGTMYPPGFDTRVVVSGVSEPLDGASRPGHFVGVATVVLKLLNLVRPDRVFLGEKDWQQLAVLRRMVTDLNVPVEVVGVPTVREPSGLAMSSRNSYLSAPQKQRAVVLVQALRAVQAAYAGGERRTSALRQAGLDVLAHEPDAEVEYLDVVGGDLRAPDSLVRDTAERNRVDNDPMTRVLVAARMYGVRLIDNLPLDVGTAPGGDA
ncbi:pantoate--beta-alanine ligase [Deinococcus sp. KSM4-11]|nr:pantoate--beta-alanine ligase [Deinococcus sp. KSM4-11]THF88975.1 pantoate--beta-alanine ligase [Deinococcus sp. KSM4-11]